MTENRCLGSCGRWSSTWWKASSSTIMGREWQRWTWMQKMWQRRSGSWEVSSWGLCFICEWGNGIILRWVGRGWSSHGGEWGRDLAARRTSESSEDPLGLKAMGFEGHLPMSCIHVRFSLHPEVGITVSNISNEVVKEESIAVWVLCSWIWSNMR